MRLPAVIAAALVALPGCAVWRALQDPQGSVASVDRVALVTDGAAGVLRFELSVPSEAGVLTEARWELWLRGRRVATGVNTQATVFLVGTQTVVQVQTPVVFPGAAAPAPGLAQVVLRGNVTLGHEGERGTFSFAEQRLITVEPRRP